MSNTVVFDEALFRAQFPAYADATKYPTVLLRMYWDEVGCFITDGGDFGMLSGSCTQLAMNCLLAHFLALAAAAAKGKQGGFKTSATVDKVSVAYLAPPASDMFSWWLSQTPYGQQLLALLELKSVGGISVGGLPERAAFRRGGGVFL